MYMCILVNPIPDLDPEIQSVMKFLGTRKKVMYFTHLSVILTQRAAEKHFQLKITVF